MTTIWKWKLDIGGTQVIKMPWDSKILTVQTQNGIPCLWAVVEPERPTVEREFLIIGTGHPFHEWCKMRLDLNFPHCYVGTFQIDDIMPGEYVFHVFEVKEYKG